MALIANSTGQPYIDGSLTTATFFGAPIVIVGDNLIEADIRWYAAKNFAANLGAPINVLAPLIGMTFEDLTQYVTEPELSFWLKKTTKFYDPARSRPFLSCDIATSATSTPGGVQILPIVGMFICMPSDQANYATLAVNVFPNTRNFIRIANALNLYGIGTFACGPAIPRDRQSAPVYSLTPDVTGSGTDAYSPTLKKLERIWKRGGPTEITSYQTLKELEPVYDADGILLSGYPERAGISSRTHPALVPYIVLR